MTDPSQPPRFPAWLAPTVVVMLGMQLVLNWLQGSLLHRQHADLLALREDVQILADAMEQGAWEEDSAEENMAPARRRSGWTKGTRWVRVLQETTPEEEQIQKDLQDAKASALKAVGEAREVQSKLSIQENIRKADEKAKVEAAENAWQKWLWVALGVGLAAVGARAWLRRRG